MTPNLSSSPNSFFGEQRHYGKKATEWFGQSLDPNLSNKCQERAALSSFEFFSDWEEQLVENRTKPIIGLKMK